MAYVAAILCSGGILQGVRSKHVCLTAAFCTFRLRDSCSAVLLCQGGLAGDTHTRDCRVIADDIGSVSAFEQTVPVLQYGDILYVAFVIRLRFAFGREKTRVSIPVCRDNTAVS